MPPLTPERIVESSRMAQPFNHPTVVYRRSAVEAAGGYQDFKQMEDYLLFARMILSWIPVLVRDWQPRGPMLVAAEVIYSVTDPPLRALRRVLKPVRIGNMMLDLAFIGLAIGVSILMQVNRAVFF